MENTIYVSRTAEQRVVEWLTIFPAVVIIGPRQVGKTSLTGAIRNQVSGISLYLDLEKPRDLARISDLESFAEAHADQLVILDEVQRKPSLFPELRSIIDEDRRPGRFILLGSASLELIRDASESLAGRIGIIELAGLTREEIGTWADFRTHWFRGGFPSSLLAASDTVSTVWRNNFLRTYLERDLAQFGLSADPIVVGRLARMVGHLSGQLLNIQTLSRSLQLDKRTVDRYLNYLEATFLIRRLRPYFTNVSKRLVKSPKIYIRDSGILHALLDVERGSDLFGHPIAGASFETFVVEQLHILAPDTAHLYFYRTQNGAELDLVIERGGTVRAVVEIKHSPTPKLSKGFHTARADLGDPPAYIIVAERDADYMLKGGIRVLGVDALNEVFA